MNREVEEVVLDHIRKRYSDEKQIVKVTVTTPLRDLHLDSLSILELIYELEEHFGIIVDDEQLLKLKTVDDICRMVSAAVPGAQTC